LIIRVQAFANLAILLVDTATVGLGTTVTSVPSASAIVVLVVAVLVLLVFGQDAPFLLAGTLRGFCLGAILALALFAIFDVAFLSTAVTIVPRATTKIVGVVAVAVAFEFRSATSLLEIFDTCIAPSLVRAVLAFAFFAVFVIFGATTVTAIPSTASIIIVVIAVAVTLPIRSPTTFFYSFGALITLC
jgi:hypothetical protein